MARSLFAIFSLAVLAALPFQGSRPLYESSEGRYALVAQEMRHSGDWLHPMIDGEHHWTKPPLTYWILAAGMTVAGENAWGARLPGVLALAVTAAATALIGTMLADRRTGGWAGIFVATGWLPLLGAYAVTTDVFVMAFATLAVAAFVMSTSAATVRANRGWLAAMWFAFGAAFLTKGPPALVGLLALEGWRRTQPRDQRPRLWTPEGLAVFLLVGASWYLVMASHTPNLMTYFVRDEVWGRLTGDVGRNQEWWKGPAIYFPALLLACGPASAYAAGRGICDWWRRQHATAATPMSLATWWTLVPLLLFLVVPSKLVLYILPLSVPVALLTAARLVPRLRNGTLIALTAVSAVFAISLRAWAPHLQSPDDMGALAAQVQRARTVHGFSDAPIALITRKPLLGLQFYLREHLNRPPGNASAAQLAAFARDFEQRQRAPGTSDGTILITPTRERGPAIPPLEIGRPDAVVVDGPFWRVILIPPRTGSLGSRGQPAPTPPLRHS